MAEEKPESTREGSSQAALVKALKEPDPDLAKGLARLGEMVTCLVEGAPQPPPIKRPPNEFRVRARQKIDKDKKTGKLYVSVDGLAVDKWKVEVVFEDSDKTVNPKDLSAADVEFDLPGSWVGQPGPRFVTVSLKEKSAPSAGRETHKAKEEPTTIIRMIPAPVVRDAAQEFDDIEVEDADE